jgi:hypothetical protein
MDLSEIIETAGSKADFVRKTKTSSVLINAG